MAEQGLAARQLHRHPAIAITLKQAATDPRAHLRKVIAVTAIGRSRTNHGVRSQRVVTENAVVVGEAALESAIASCSRPADAWAGRAMGLPRMVRAKRCAHSRSQVQNSFHD